MTYDNLFTQYNYVEIPPILTDETKQVLEEYYDLIDNPSDLEFSIPSGMSLEDWAKNNLEFKESPVNNLAISPPKRTPIKAKKSPSIAEQAIDLASLFIGHDYKWGGISPITGFDCSGIGYYSFRQFGVNMPRTAKEMAKFGTAVPIDKVQKGDWIVTKSSGKSGYHVVWVTGRNEDGSILVINAKGQKDGIISSTFNNYKNVVSARRLTSGKFDGSSNFERALQEAIKINPEVAEHEEWLRKTKSVELDSDDYTKLNTAGAPYYGWPQMGAEEIKRTTGLTVALFRNDPVQQILGAVKLYKLNLEAVKRLGVYQLCKLKGYSDDAIVAGTWLGGPGGVKKFITGQGDPSDSHWYGGKRGSSVGKRMREFNT